MIKRDYYLNRLIAKKENGLIKIITGIRRCGKSYLLFELYKNYLKSLGIDDGHIIQIQLDRKSFDDCRNPNMLYDFIVKRINDREKFYILIDEIQLCYRIKKDGIDESSVPEEDRGLLYTTFYDILNDLMCRSNLDIYVTGSNSRLLSKDVATNFRDRGVEIQLYPLSFSEYYEYAGLDKSDAWEEYMTFGGMPLAVLEKDEKEKAEYLKNLFSKIYIADIKERYNLKDEESLGALMDVIFSSVGSLTNPHKLNNTLSSVRHTKLSDHTVKKYLDFLEDAFIIKKADRYDVKGKSYLDFPSKYYVSDIGLRNSRLNFRQGERTHIMENIIFNELVSRGYSVDVGVVQVSCTGNGIQRKSNLEIDFIVNKGFEKIYIQSAFSMDDPQKKEQEIRPLLKSGDFFKKMVILGGNQKRSKDENGIIYLGVIPFLLEKDSVEK
ncbi:MAG: ATP-binding protein [Treponema sp.]|nr:ATP-binding protein [Treponema sp.]